MKLNTRKVNTRRDIYFIYRLQTQYDMFDSVSCKPAGEKYDKLYKFYDSSNNKFYKLIIYIDNNNSKGRLIK